MKEETERWIQSGKKDIKQAKDNLKIGNYKLASFLCQQAVEKILKASLIEKTGKFPKIHDLIRLGELASLNNEILKECEKLNSVYIESRYPDVSTDEYTETEAKDDIKSAEKILKWTEERL